MKIFYAIQATGNGHISRAMELIPYLQEHGTIDIFLSGNNSHLSLDFPIKYRSKGLSLYYNSSGSLDYWKILRGIHPFTLRKEIQELPVEKYDLVINDFEFITAAACARKKVHSIQVGHQASFQSSFVPRPTNRNAIGEWVLKNYAKAADYVGLHFDQYDDFILHPVIKKEILNAQPIDKGHITVYLPSYSDHYLENVFRQHSDLRFHIFSKEVKQETQRNNILLVPVAKDKFNKSLVECHGIITGAGFETPAEALYLGKKILAIPAGGQYEQLCNAAALEKLRVVCPEKVNESFRPLLSRWIESSQPITLKFADTVPRLINRLLSIHASKGVIVEEINCDGPLFSI